MSGHGWRLKGLAVGIVENGYYEQVGSREQAFGDPHRRGGGNRACHCIGTDRRRGGTGDCSTGIQDSLVFHDREQLHLLVEEFDMVAPMSVSFF